MWTVGQISMGDGLTGGGAAAVKQLLAKQTKVRWLEEPC